MPRSATVSTVEHCEFFILEREKLLDLLVKSPQLIKKLLAGMSEKIRDVNDKFFQEILVKNQEVEKALGASPASPIIQLSQQRPKCFFHLPSVLYRVDNT